MAPPTVPPNPSVYTDVSQYFGKNVKIENSVEGGLDIGALQLKSISTLSSYGLNINNSTGCSLSISSSGDISTLGTLSTSTIESSGLSVKNADNSTVFSVNGSGDVTASGDVSAVNVTASGDLSVVKVTASGDLSAVNVTASGDFSGHNVTASGDLSVVNVTAAGYAKSSFTNYVAASCDDNTTYTSTHPTSSEPSSISLLTGTYLTTQAYVDTQLWKQTKRINSIVGIDSETVENFNNVYKLFTTLTGQSDVVQVLEAGNAKYDSLVDESKEIKINISTIVAQSVQPVNVLCSPAIWADGGMPLPIPGVLSTNNNGWYFENMLEPSSTNKINWYLPVASGMKLKDIQNLYLNTFLASNVSCPFITVYTKHKKDSNGVALLSNRRSWHHSVIVYVFDFAEKSKTYNKQCCLYTANDQMNNYNIPGFKVSSVTTRNNFHNVIEDTGITEITYDSSILHNDVLPEDDILYLSIGTDSASATGNIRFVANSLGVQRKTGTTEFNFLEEGASTNFLYMNNYHINKDFSAPLQHNINLFNIYKSTYLNNISSGTW